MRITTRRNPMIVAYADTEYTERNDRFRGVYIYVAMS